MGVIPTEHLPWLVAALGVAAFAVLFWRTRTASRDYALDLAESERVASEARERVEALARESQAKSEMLATVSRDVRGHLNGIIGSADLMLDEALPPAAGRHLQTLRAAAESLQRSVNDVLDFSNVETGQLQLARVPFDLPDLLAGVIEQLDTAARLRGIEVVLIVPAEVRARVVGDAARLRQIMLAFVARAISVTLGGRIVVRVELPSESAAPSRSGGTWMRFSVTEHSTGLTEMRIATLFDPPRAGGAPAPRRPGGSGLELFVCRRLVEFMGGSIGARRLPDIGAEVWTVLPFEPDRSPAPPPVEPVPAGLYAVVLDSDGASRIALSAMLSRLGVEHGVADEYEDAVEQLTETPGNTIRTKVLIAEETMAMASASPLRRLLLSRPPGDAIRLVMLARNPDAVRTSVSVLGDLVLVRKPLLRIRTLLESLGVPSALAEHTQPRVLVVDDDEISRSVAVQLLERQGCVAERASSGADAIKRVQDGAFDLIFMDCQMPDLDGYDTTRRIRAQLGEGAPPIVALTANTTPSDRERAYAAGMVDFVEKPVRRSELGRVVERWIPRGAPAPSAGPRP